MGDEGKGLKTFADLLKTELKGHESEENVRVVIRVRPLSQQEEKNGNVDIVVVNKGESQLTVLATTKDRNEGENKVYTFDAIFGQDSTQAEVYNQTARPIIENVIRGYNGTILAYGQTGTGKTFTMEGVNEVPELKGIIPNSFAQIFSHISKCNDSERFLVRVSYLEIYNEEVRDLLGKDQLKKLELKERPEVGIYVKDLSSFVVRNTEEMDKIMRIGNKHRSVGSTNMNTHSSRSHAIFTIAVECCTEQGGRKNIRMGKLNLVDLAGSERISKTGATGDRMRESTKINLSLSNLGNVISALVDVSSHVPYRNSKLTRLLQDSLGGNAKTVMCANVGPSNFNRDETINTLRYASRAKKIKNLARINEDPKDALLRKFELEIENLRRQLREQEEAGDDQEFEDGGGEGRLHSANSQNDLSANEVTDLVFPDDIKEELLQQEEIAQSLEKDTEERKMAVYTLREKLDLWKDTEEQKSKLQERLRTMKRRILVGGENLLDKSQIQEQLLMNSMQELEKKKEEEKQLTTSLNTLKNEKALLEEEIEVTRESMKKAQKQLKKVWTRYKTSRAELNQFLLESQSESITVMEDIKTLSRELTFYNLVIESYIPTKYLRTIEKSSVWKPDESTWYLHNLPYTGNNLQPHFYDHENGDQSAIKLPINYQQFHNLRTRNPIVYGHYRYLKRKAVRQMEEENARGISTGKFSLNVENGKKRDKSIDMSFVYLSLKDLLAEKNEVKKGEDEWNKINAIRQQEEAYAYETRKIRPRTSQTTLQSRTVSRGRAESPADFYQSSGKGFF